MSTAGEKIERQESQGELALEKEANDTMTESPKKKRNPPWTREELIRALELYLREGLLDDHSPKVLQ